MQVAETSDSYGGSLIDFDLPSALSETSEYVREFSAFLTKNGYADVKQIPGRANLVQAEQQGTLFWFYFQGAGTVAWWAFAKAVIEKGLQKCPGQFRLALGLKKNGETRYWSREVENSDTQKDRLMLAGENPAQFQPAFLAFEEKKGER